LTSRTPKETLEALDELLESLKEANRTVPVIVEGDKDVAALRALGLTGEVIRLNQGVSLVVFCECLSARCREVIILTDWDRKGGQLCRHLTDHCDDNDVKYDLHFRMELALLCKKEIKDVQSLPKYIHNLEERVASSHD
jgi:5S rRNA maturation endonuclease (ribonuclease M5)